ncbi:MAG: hypothetical protein WAQ27_05175 [Candidatus Microsaccharimonas sp.]
MPFEFLKDIGSTDEIRRTVTEALGTSDTGEVFLLLDVARTIRVDRMQRLNDEFVVHAVDVVDGSSIILHLPFENSAAQAAIITYSKGES